MEFTVSLDCEVSKPNRVVVWYKDGIEIKDDKRRKYYADGAIHTLNPMMLVNIA